tara:strand:- start:518 stop:814 length:297 start_codon:yes stop_codon:yes gene_type:complete
VRKPATNMRKLSSVIKKIVSNPKISDKLENLKIIEIWNEILGNNLQKYIIDSKVYNRKLLVKIKSSTLRNELGFKKTDLINQINKRFGKKIIDEIILK